MYKEKMHEQQELMNEKGKKKIDPPPKKIKNKINKSATQSTVFCYARIKYS